MVKSNSRAISEYLDTGGNCLEILHILETSDSTVPPALVFEIVTNILLAINANYPQHQSTAYESCRYTLNTYITLINKMLGLNSTVNERKTVLKFLTAIVTFSATLAKDVLLNVNFNPTNIELLSKQTGEVDSVRLAFIHFLISLLVDGQYPTLVLLLERKGLLTSIINGLIYDPADCVCMVMSALKNHILENPSVSKTMKMKTFSTPVVKNIVNLYNWKGQTDITSHKKKKKPVVLPVSIL